MDTLIWKVISLIHYGNSLCNSNINWYLKGCWFFFFCLCRKVLACVVCGRLKSAFQIASRSGSVADVQYVAHQVIFLVCLYFAPGILFQCNSNLAGKLELCLGAFQNKLEQFKTWNVPKCTEKFKTSIRYISKGLYVCIFLCFAFWFCLQLFYSDLCSI